MRCEGAEKEYEEDKTVFAAVVGYGYFFQSVSWGSCQRYALLSSCKFLCLPSLCPAVLGIMAGLGRLGKEVLRVFLERCGDHPQRGPRLLLHPTQHLRLGLRRQESI